MGCCSCWIEDGADDLPSHGVKDASGIREGRIQEVTEVGGVADEVEHPQPVGGFLCACEFIDFASRGIPSVYSAVGVVDAHLAQSQIGRNFPGDRAAFRNDCWVGHLI